MYQHTQTCCADWTVVETRQPVPIIHHHRSSVTPRPTAENPLLGLGATPLPGRREAALWILSLYPVGELSGFIPCCHCWVSSKYQRPKEAKRSKHREIAITGNKTILHEQRAETILGPEDARNTGTQVPLLYKPAPSTLRVKAPCIHLKLPQENTSLTAVSSWHPPTSHRHRGGRKQGNRPAHSRQATSLSTFPSSPLI